MFNEKIGYPTQGESSTTRSAVEILASGLVCILKLRNLTMAILFKIYIYTFMYTCGHAKLASIVS